MYKKALSLAIGILIIISIGVLILLILSMLFSKQMANFSKSLEAPGAVYEFCKKIYERYYGSSENNDQLIFYYFFELPTYDLDFKEMGSKIFKKGICKKYSFIFGVDEKKVSLPPTTTKLTLCETPSSCVQIDFELVKIIYSYEVHLFQS
ncbi:MAG: hypothetical protein QXR30_01645 [Candidatus Woesearchaeota archaeon]